MELLRLLDLLLRAMSHSLLSWSVYRRAALPEDCWLDLEISLRLWYVERDEMAWQSD